MSKRCRWSLYAISALLIIGLMALIWQAIFFSGIFFPMIKLVGDAHIQIEVNSEFLDPGIQASYRFQDISEDVKVEGNLNTTRLGTYFVRYTLETYDKQVERKVEVVDTSAPIIQLDGGDHVRVFENETYVDPGYQAMDNYDGDLTKQVQVLNQSVDMHTQGVYEVQYQVSDSSGNTNSITRKVEVCSDPTLTKVYYNHDDYNNEAEEWWFRKSEEHKRTTAARDEQFLAKYDAYFMGPDEKTVYLTFDEGGNDITYIKQIADILNENEVKATFFLTRNYIKDNPAFMNDLVAHGHVIGNHSWHHYDMPTLANSSGIDKFVLEVTETEKTYMQVTGQPMKKVFRFPKGGMSERSLKIIQDLGYTNYFWSHAYYDYASDVSKEEALKTLMDHYHNGAIYLLHPSNKGNYEAMDTFLKAMKEEGYSFDTVDHIPKEQEAAS